MPTIQIANTDEEIARCFPVMAQLRSHLVKKEFVARIRRQNAGGGYQLAFLQENGHITSLAGFRFLENLYYGRFLYVDDLITDERARSKGHGGLLLDWLIEHARQNNCDVLALDSGVQRFAAHRFYLRKRMEIVCHHFALKLR